MALSSCMPSRIIQRSDCATHSLPFQHNGQNRVWASLGARYVALISQSNMFFSILITILFIIIFISAQYLSGSFKPVKSEFVPLLLQLSFLMDCYLVSIFYHLSKTTGPNAIGYALCHQFSTFQNSNHPSSRETPIKSSTNSITSQLLSDKAPFMKSMLLIEKFFTYYSIQKYGCVYTSSGQVNKVDNITNTAAVDNDHDNLLPLPLSEQYLRGIGKFFRECLSDSDIRYDTYVLYYIGPDNNKGDWIFEDESVITLKNLIDLWELACLSKSFKNLSRSMRLLILLDTLHSEEWCKSLTKWNTQCCIAIQSAIPVFSSNSNNNNTADQNHNSFIGMFTEFWIKENISRISYPSQISSVEELRGKLMNLSQPIKFIYSTTNSWFNFQLRVPSIEEINKYLKFVFPKPLQKLYYTFLSIFQINKIDNKNTTNNNNNVCNNRDAEEKDEGEEMTISQKLLLLLSYTKYIFYPLNILMRFTYTKVTDQYRQMYFAYFSSDLLEIGHGFILMRT
uniref:Transmembrane protein 168 n=1 Tax=Trichobilharzia regenti TaxID=157069 RepID=A0AA85K2X6_TRIRE|nr:unnamed protein product [Trichobilharzia regenti]